MNKKPPELPNIEDATLRACLAPLMDAMNAGGEQASQAVSATSVVRTPQQRIASAGSNDNPLPATDTMASVGHERSAIPKTLAEWRLEADEAFSALRMVELFLAMTEAELTAAVAEFPKQIAGTVTRLGRIRQRLISQYDRVTAAVALLERARTQASQEAATD